MALLEHGDLDWTGWDEDEDEAVCPSQVLCVYVLLGPIAQGGELRDVKLLAGDLPGAILRDQLIETVLLPSYCNDEDTGIDHPFRQGPADAGCCPGDEHSLVWEWHRVEDGKITVLGLGK